MSRYTPNPVYLRVTQRQDGHWIDDQFGQIDGPYPSSRDAWSVIAEMERDWRGEQQSN